MRVIEPQQLAHEVGGIDPHSITTGFSFTGNAAGSIATQQAMATAATADAGHSHAVFDSVNHDLVIDLNGNGMIDSNDMTIHLTGTASLASGDFSIM